VLREASRSAAVALRHSAKKRCSPSDTIRLMRIAFLGLFAIAAVISFAANEREAARASHRQSWVTWSNKTGLSVKTIERLWRVAMGSDGDEEFGPDIENIDAQTLSSRKQILFVL